MSEHNGFAIERPRIIKIKYYRMNDFSIITVKWYNISEKAINTEG